ncbi:Lactadherin [Mactra antiquata]
MRKCSERELKMVEFCKSVVLLIACVAVLVSTEPIPVCESLKSPVNGLVQCSGNTSMLICNGVCNTDFIFDTGDKRITRECNSGTWTGYNFPRCIEDKCVEKQLKTVKDSQITVSSEWKGVIGYSFGPERARLDSSVTVGTDGIVQSGGWRAAVNTLEQYIQVELNEITRITGIITKGRAVLQGDTANEFVTRYRLLYSLDGQRWEPYSSETVNDQFLPGNTDNESPKVNTLACPFDAKFVRINPLAWHENIALRFDLLGCRPEGPNACRSQTTMKPVVQVQQTTTLAPDLCTAIPPPTNGLINCESQGNQLVCVSNCVDGYIFETKEILIKRVCQQSTGTWSPTPHIPSCIHNIAPSFNDTHGCLTTKKECHNVGNGDFHACGGCHFFASCSEGYLYVRACPEDLLFDAISSVCDYNSRTCPRNNLG